MTTDAFQNFALFVIVAGPVAVFGLRFLYITFIEPVADQDAAEERDRRRRQI
jgi:hypothetical protein